MRQKRNLLATLFLSQGVPMLSGGDEVGRTQRGNNNAYCQDNDISWTHWDLSEDQQAFLAFARRVVALRRDHPVLRRRNFLHGRQLRGSGVRDIVWLAPGGEEMTDAEWNAEGVKCLGARLAGGVLGETDDEGRPVVGETLLSLLNSDAGAVDFVLPAFEAGLEWRCLIDTFDEAREGQPCASGAGFRLGGHSLAVFVGVPAGGHA